MSKIEIPGKKIEVHNIKNSLKHHRYKSTSVKTAQVRDRADTKQPVVLDIRQYVYGIAPGARAGEHDVILQPSGGRRAPRVSVL